MEKENKPWILDLLEEPNLVDVIAHTCGWNPLIVNAEMIVHYDNKEYVIKRTK